MNKKQADTLLNQIERVIERTAPARVHQIGNGEWIIILKVRNYHIWSYEDWLDYCQEKDMSPVPRPHKRTSSAREPTAIDPATEYRLAV